MKKTLCSFILLLFISASAIGQCGMTVSYTYTQGANGQVSFTSAVTGGVSPYTYYWYLGTDSLYYTQPNQTFTFPANYTYHVCVVVYDANYCSANYCNDITITNAQTYSCTGAATFTTSSNGVATDFNFSPGASVYRNIDYGDGSSDLINNNNVSIEHAYNLNGTYTVKCKAYSLVNNFTIYCDSSAQTITVNNIPCHADFVLDTNNRDTAFVFLLNNSTNCASNRWYKNDSLFATNTDDIFLSSLPNGIYTFCLAISGPNGCSDSICKTDTINVIPTCHVTFSDSVLSSPCASYQFTTTDTSWLTSIQWTVNNNLVSSSFDPVIQLDFSSTQNSVYSYPIDVTASGNNCTASSAFNIENPAAYDVFKRDSTTHIWTIYPDYNVANIASQTWDFGDGTSSTEAYPTHTYADSGIYTICHQIVLTNSCTYNYCYNHYLDREEQGNTIIQLIVEAPGVTTAVKTTNEPVALNYYPNPATEEFTISMDAVFSPNTTFSLFNSLGQMVTSSVLPASNSFTISVKQFPAGIYYFTLGGDNKTIKRGKLIVVK